MGDLVLVYRDPHAPVATITLNRPEKRNAMSTELLAELNAAYESVLDVEDIDCVVLTGADPSFCAGMDLAEVGGGGRNLSIDFFTKLWETSTPTIAAVNGVAATGGLELALACDMIVASEKARFVDTHTRVGVLPGAGMSVLLPAVVGVRKATEMSLTGEPLTAPEAERYGLVNRVVRHDDLIDAATALAHEICRNSGALTKRMNRLIKDNARLSIGDGLENEHRSFVEFLSRGLSAEGVEARRTDVIARGREQA